MTSGFTFECSLYPQVRELVPAVPPRPQPLSFIAGSESVTWDNSQKTAFDLRVQKDRLIKWGMRDTQKQRAYDAEFAMRDECRGKEYASVKECQRRVDQIVGSAWWKKHAGLRRNLRVTVGDGRGHRRAVSYGGYIALPKWARCELVILHELAHEACPRGEKHGPQWARMFYDLLRRFLDPAVAERFLVECAARNVKMQGKRLPRSKVTDEQRETHDKQRAERRTPKYTVFCQEHGQHASGVGYCVRCRAEQTGRRAFVTDKQGWAEWRIAAAEPNPSDDGNGDTP